MKKAGTIHTPRNELKPPAWLALAQLLFAAVLLYVIRNPLSFEVDNTYALNEKQSEPAIIVHIPLSNVAVAAPSKQNSDDLPM